MVTATEVLAAVRKQRRLCERVDVARPMTAAVVLARFEARMKERGDLGLSSRSINLLFESRNPFEPTRRRKPKMETVVFGALLILVIAALLSFNLL